jgi:hypothetical protein
MTMGYHTHKGNGQLSKPNIILLHTYNLGSVVFTWSILSWIMHKNSSFDCTNFVFQVWYKFLHDSWCQICFYNLASYSRTSLLFFPNLDIKSFGDSQIVHFVNMNFHFCTSTFKWCLFLNLLIANWEIRSMFNSLLICKPTNTIYIYKAFHDRCMSPNIYWKIHFNFPKTSFSWRTPNSR